MNDQTKSFQHYVPRFLLVYFTEDEKLRVFDRQKKEFRTQTPKNTAGEKAFYVFEAKDGSRKDDLEKMFAEIEGVAAGVIKIMINDKTIQNLSDQDKTDLSVFLAALSLRVPQSLKKSERMSEGLTKAMLSKSVMFEEHFQKGMDEIEKKAGKPISQKERKDIQKTFRDKKYDLKFPKGYLLGVMVKNLLEIAGIMCQMEWTILRAPKQKAFITSDNPVYTINLKPEGFWSSGIGLLAPNCETTAILTPKLAIFLSQNHSPESAYFMNCPPHIVDTFNFRTAVTSDRFVISHSDALLKKIVERTKVDIRGPYSKVKVD